MIDKMKKFLHIKQADSYVRLNMRKNYNLAARLENTELYCKE